MFCIRYNSPRTIDEIAQLVSVKVRKEINKEIPYKEGKMKDVGSRVGYTLLYMHVEAEVCDNATIMRCHVIAVLSAMREVCITCACAATFC